MSGILKKIGQVFKKVVSSKIFKYVAIAVAVYFTAGIALGAMGVGFAATLPGITAAGQAIGLAGVGAIADVGAAAGAAVGLTADAAATIGAGATGAADLAAGGIATEGIGSTIAATAAEGGALATGSAADIAGGMSDGSLALTGSAPDAITGAVTPGVTTGAGAPAGLTGGGTGEVSTMMSDAAGGHAASAAGSSNIFGSLGDGAKGVLKYFDNNPTVAKAAMTFGSDALKAGVGMYAQKSQAETAQQNAAALRGRESAPILSNPVDYTKYNKGIVNAVAGTGAPTTPPGP